jgi:serine/threonine protein kinase
LTGRGFHALKLLDEEAQHAEMQALQKLRYPGHENVIRLLGVYRSDSSQYVVAIPVAECNLQQFLEARAGIVAMALPRQFATQLASCVAYMHNASLVMHRDLKPCNVLMTVGDTAVARLCIADMGRARDIQGMAPRRCHGKTVVNDSRVGVERQFPNMTTGQIVWIYMPQCWETWADHRMNIRRSKSIV